MKFKEKLDEMIGKGYVPYQMGWGDEILGTVPNSILGHQFVEMDISRKNESFFANLSLIQDAVAFKDAPMPGWVLVDCVAAVNASIGLALPREKLPKGIDQKFSEKMESEFKDNKPEVISRWKDYEGLVPISRYDLLPSGISGRYSNCTLSSAIEGIGLATLNAAMGIYTIPNVEKIWLCLQYNNSALRVHTKIGNIKLQAANAYAHNIPGTISGVIDVHDKAYTLDKMFTKIDKPEIDPSFLLHEDDIERQSSLQYNIENRIAAYTILRPGKMEPVDKALIPVLEQRY